MLHSNLAKTFISRHIPHQHWYTCPIALPARRNPQHRSLLTAASATSVSTFSASGNVYHQVVSSFTRLTLPTWNISLWISFTLGPFAHKTTHNRTMLFGNTRLKHGRCFDYWNQLLNMRMWVWYLSCHEAGLCCYLVIHIENLLRPLQLFYFHSWPIYWLFLLCIYRFICSK
jgi:hypothetical protein